MPAKCQNDFSITIRFGVPVVPILPIDLLVSIFDEYSQRYAIAYEQKDNSNSGHYQCGISLRSPRRSDKFKATFISHLESKMTGFAWSDDNRKHAVVVKAHNNLVVLCGGYCTKQSINPVFKGFTPEELEGGKDRYAVLESSARKRLPVSKSALLPLLKEYYDRVQDHVAMSPDFHEIFSKKNPSEKINLLESLILADGHDLSDVFAGIRRNYIVKNFDLIFSPENSVDILEKYFVTP